MSNRHLSPHPATSSQIHSLVPFQFVVKTATSLSQQIFTTILNSTSGQQLFVYGPVNSGKSLTLCTLADAFQDAGKSCRCIQPDLSRSDLTPDTIISSAGKTYPALSVSTKQQLFDVFSNNTVVLVDEVQFLSPTLHSFFLQLLREYTQAGNSVILVGLRYTALQSEFALSAALMSRVDQSFELASLCAVCQQEKAFHNQRLLNGEPSLDWNSDFVDPSASITYEPRCKNCLITRALLAP